jgi:hypothetical protein
MARLLFDRNTNQTFSYPREDDLPVVGLDRSTFYVLKVIQAPKPQYDSEKFQLQPLDPTITITDSKSDDLNGTATYGWELVAIPPAPPAPDWFTFKTMVLTNQVLNQAIANSIPRAPAAALALPAALLKAEEGSIDDFRGCWQVVVAVAPIIPEDIAQFVALAQSCYLPQEFIAVLALQQETEGHAV